jgi:hypothetical protein
MRKIAGRHLQIHFVANLQRCGLPHSPRRHVPEQRMPVHQFHPEQFCLFQDLDYEAFKADDVFSRHVKISGSPSVMSTVCSKWADN